MKLRNREVNVFSMSALDLFASSMGAFMLLAVMALPFFPNTGDSPELVAEVKAELEKAKEERDQVKQERDKAEQKAEELAKELSDVKVPDLDLVICLDLTSSMGGVIDALKREIRDLGSVLDALAPTVGIGVVAFGDTTWPRTLYRLDIDTNIKNVREFVSTLEPDLGRSTAGDGPEAIHGALAQAVSLSWRPIAKRRYIVVISDTPDVDHLDLALEAAGRFSSQDGRFVSAIVAGGAALNAYTLASMKSLAEAGKGSYIDGREDSAIGSILLAIFGP